MYLNKFNHWLSSDELSSSEKSELINLEEEEKEDRFYKELEFGTAGMRGILGLGTNRLNIYTIARVAQGLANVIISHKGESKGVVIGYDVRHMSREFAELTSEILSSNGIKVYLFDNIIPTPIVSYAIRELKAISGVMITASHNPKEYNGYKVYWEDGSQISSSIATEITNNINKLKIFEKIERDINYELIEPISKELIDKYMSKVLSLSIHDNINKDINIVYSPLNGTGNKYVRDILNLRGFNQVYVVKEQSYPDGNFENTPFPNPEDIESFELAVELGNKVNGDILITTDPDADRIGVMVKHNSNYEFLSGNQIGALLVNYILSGLKNTEGVQDSSKIVTTIVTDTLAEDIARDYGVSTLKTHVGFKNIYSLANKWDKINEGHFILGYEESFGFGIGDKIARDKDAVSASMIISEMAAYYKSTGKTLIDIYNELEEIYGHHEEEMFSVKADGLEGQDKINTIINEFKSNPVDIKGVNLINKIDYSIDDTGLEKMNVIKYKYDNGVWFVIRPSGTEPKIKFYIYSVSRDDFKAKDNLEKMIDRINEKVSKVIK